jgi:phosphoglycolate phosphatase
MPYRPRLVMWDIDRTLVRARGVGQVFVDTVTAMVGAPPAAGLPTFAGRTDLDVATELFASHGVEVPDLDDFFARYVTAVHARADDLRARGEVLPGAVAALAALTTHGGVTQTVVTGNIRPVAEFKLRSLGAATGIDFEVGGYGTEDSIRATLVRRSWERAQARYGAFDTVVVIGDTALDVAGALANGAIAVGVATGGTSAADLKAAGAHHVLDSLADTEQVLRLLTS